MPAAFDVLISTIFVPFGSVPKLRTDAIDRIGVKPGTSGTGGITKLLLAHAGRTVTAHYDIADGTAALTFARATD